VSTQKTHQTYEDPFLAVVVSRVYPIHVIPCSCPPRLIPTEPSPLVESRLVLSERIPR
jgi:hypothetical protein